MTGFCTHKKFQISDNRNSYRYEFCIKKCKTSKHMRMVIFLDLNDNTRYRNRIMFK